jgi:CubicO group peptidase (beta-lactamase class C family)
MIIFFKFFLLGLFLATLASSCKTNKKETQTESVVLSTDTLALATKKMQEYVEREKLARISTLVFKDGDVVHRDRIGFVDIDMRKKVSDSSIYRIFSMTKPITAVAMMRLYDEGKIALDDKVSKYIPAFADTQVYAEVDRKHSSEPQKTEMILRHLLTHTSGIVYGWAESYTDSVYATKNFMGVDRPILEMVEDLATIPLKFQPGTKWEYGMGIDIAGAVVEVASGQPLDQYFKTIIFDPLGMEDTAFYIPIEKVERLAELYQRTEEGNLVPNEAMRSRNVGTSPKLFLGGAGLVSTIADYEKFYRMILNKGTLNGNRILSEQAI